MPEINPLSANAGEPLPGWLRALEIIAGIILVVLSFMVWGFPIIAGLTVVFIFGLALIVLGTMRMGEGIFDQALTSGMRALLVLLGILLVGIGLYAIAAPLGGALTMIYFFAFALMLAGVDRLALAGGGRQGPELPSWARYFSIIAGIFAIIAAFIVLIFPGFGAALLFVIISIAILILGIELIVSGIRGQGITPI
jgi:uncharacterized membrane protein HdeD (DUF308 family)